ncbi:MAG: hypothetical protein EBT92_16570, partial [Planctomycetes bacterium]|nr:hypothetical protein [Planctomycetota bacterium]
MAYFITSLLFNSLFSKNKSAPLGSKKIYRRRLELEGMESRITPATVSVVNNQVVLTLVNSENISNLHTALVGNILTITDATNKNNTSSGVIPAGITVNTTNVVVDTSIFNTFAGLVVNAAGGNQAVTIVVNSTGIDLSAVPGNANQSVSIDLSVSADNKDALTINSPITTKGTGTVDLNATTITLAAAGDITTNAGNVDITGATKIETAGDITTSGGNITFNDALTLAGNIILTGTTPTFTGGVTGAGHDLTLNFSGTTTIGAKFAGIKNLATNSGGTTSLSGTITTTGTQTYSDAVTLTADTTLNSGANDILFGSTLNGAFNLNVNSSTVTTFSGVVGGIGTALTSLITNSGGTTAINGGAITTTGAQTYSDAVTLGANTILTGSTPTFTGGVTGAGHDLTLNFSGTTTIGANFTGIKNLATNSGGTTSLSGTITTTGAQTYNDAVTLGANTILDAGVGNISFGSTLNGAFSLNAKSSGITTFSGVVGGIGTALTSLIANSGGTTAINGGAITTTGAQTYNDAVTLGANTILTTSTGNIAFGSTLNGAFNLDLNAGAGAITGTSVAINNLIITNGASASFTGAVTVNDLITTAHTYSVSMTGTGNTYVQNVDFLNSGLVTLGDSGDTFLFNGGLNFTGNAASNLAAIITSSGDDINFGTGGVTLVASSTANSTGGDSGADITFGGIVAVTADNAQALTVNASINNTITFGADVGAPALRLSAFNLTAFSVNYGGDVYVASSTNFGNVVLTANQTFTTNGTASFGTIDGATFDMNIVAADLALTGNVTNIGTLGIENILAAGAITLMGSGGLAIETQTEWNHIQPSVNFVVLGNTGANVGVIDVAAAWINNNSVTVDFKSGGAGKFNVNGVITTTTG